MSSSRARRRSTSPSNQARARFEGGELHDSGGETVDDPALAAAFEEEILRCDLGLAGHADAKIAQKQKSVRKRVGSARVCALPSLAQIKGGKGHLFGWKYRRLQPGEVTVHYSH